MGQVQITLSYRFLERFIFILIILVLGYLLLTQYMGGQSCDPLKNETQPVENQQPPSDNNNTDGEQQKEEKDQNQKNESEQEDQQNESDSDSNDQQDDTQDNTDQNEDQNQDQNQEESGSLEVTMGDVDFEVTNTSTKVNSITITVENGLDDSAKLFATISITQTGNDKIGSVNPLWDEAEMELVSSGETKVMEIKPNSGSYALGVEDGETVTIEGTFTDLQGSVNKSSTASQTV